MPFALVVGLILAAGTPSFAVDRSSFYFDLNTGSTVTLVHMLIMDPLGRQTGCIPASGFSAQDIPNSSYVLEAIDNVVTGESGPEGVIFFVRPIMPGTYTVTLFGMAPTTYRVLMLADDSTGESAPPTEDILQGYLTASASRQYVLQYNPTPGAPKSVVKVVTFDVLRQDLLTAKELNQIGGDKFVKSLLRMIDKAEKLTEKHKKPKGRKHGIKVAAVKILKAFIKRLDKAAKHEFDDYDEDKEWKKWRKKHKRFITPEALVILKEDAKSLIVQLGGKVKKEKKDKKK